MGLDNTLSLPTPLIVLTGQCTCAPWSDSCHCFYLTHSHPIPTHFYHKNGGRMFFQNSGAQLQDHLVSQTRRISPEPFLWSLSAAPHFGYFYTCFQNTFCSNHLPIFQQPAETAAGTTNSAPTGTLMTWYEFLGVYEKLELITISYHGLLMVAKTR